jgi:hypothetical protein
MRVGVIHDVIHSRLIGSDSCSDQILLTVRQKCV